MRHRIRAILPAAVTALALACQDGSEHDLAGAPAVAVEVGGVGFDEANHAPIILLEESGGERMLPIWIGPFEARSIASEMERLEAPRPNTHDLARTLLERLGARVLRATVTELRGSTYYAVLRIEGEHGVLAVDARPSDAIAVALRCGAPLFVASALLEAQGGSEPGASEESERLGDESREPESDAEEDELLL